MSKTYEFWGASDDLFEAEGAFEEEQCQSRREPVMAYVIREPDTKVGLIVTATYAPDILPDGCWLLGVAPLFEDCIPDWPVRFVPNDNGYSYRVVIEASDTSECAIWDAAGNPEGGEQ